MGLKLLPQGRSHTCRRATLQAMPLPLPLSPGARKRHLERRYDKKLKSELCLVRDKNITPAPKGTEKDSMARRIQGFNP